jgi:uncharacterized protein (DUF1501 family)
MNQLPADIDYGEDRSLVWTGRFANTFGFHKTHATGHESCVAGGAVHGRGLACAAPSVADQKRTFTPDMAMRSNLLMYPRRLIEETPQICENGALHR